VNFQLHRPAEVPPQSLVGAISADQRKLVCPSDSMLSYAFFCHSIRVSGVSNLHVPLLPNTRGMISAAKLCLVIENAILSNTARSGLAKENDVWKL
jgi:hypothetical protein